MYWLSRKLQLSCIPVILSTDQPIYSCSLIISNWLVLDQVNLKENIFPGSKISCLVGNNNINFIQM